MATDNPALDRAVEELHRQFNTNAYPKTLKWLDTDHPELIEVDGWIDLAALVHVILGGEHDK